MHRLVPIAALVLASIAPAAAESFRGRVQDGHARLDAGDVDGAMGAYRDLQTDHPESDILYYNMGRAHYEQGLQDLADDADDAAQEAFEAGKAAFEKVVSSTDATVRRDASYNLANTVAQLAKLSVGSGQFDPVVAAFEEAVKQYEETLRKYPDHAQARNNLDHMRYFLKKMLQNPPEKQEQEQNQEQNQEQQEQQDQQYQQNEDQEQESQEPQQQEQEQQQEPEQQEPEEPQEEPEERRENVEALLESLEDRDKREQREIRRMPGRPRPTMEWW